MSAKGGLAGHVRRAICALLIAVFLLVCSRYYIPGKGFSYLVVFGSRNSGQFLPELKRLNHYEFEGTYGYDGQYYAEIAMHPRLADPTLGAAVDGLTYRARRILFCLLPYLVAGGNPSRALQVFAVQNIFAWAAIALLLFRWLPPAENWGNVARWIAIVFSLGLCSSVGRALLDGPSLLLILLGVACAEAARPRWATAILGLSGLAKETNLLAAAALPIPARNAGSRPWLRLGGRLLIVAAPLIAWTLVLNAWIGGGGDLGARNFAWPFVGFFRRWRELESGWDGLAMTALTAQLLFFLCRPRWREPWWRLGAAYALLALILGDAVWEGYPGAASRVLLPMTVAFNLLAPRNWRGWLLLAVGNASLLCSTDAIKPPGRDSARIEGPRAMRMIEATGDIVTVTFNDRDWYGPERSLLDYWRWSRGSAAIAIYNPQRFPLEAEVDFRLKGVDRRHVSLLEAGHPLWNGEISRELQPVSLHDVVLPPGTTEFQFETDRAPAFPPGDARGVGFSLRSLALIVRGK